MGFTPPFTAPGGCHPGHHRTHRSPGCPHHTPGPHVPIQIRRILARKKFPFLHPPPAAHSVACEHGATAIAAALQHHSIDGLMLPPRLVREERWICSLHALKPCGLAERRLAFYGNHPGFMRTFSARGGCHLGHHHRGLRPRWPLHSEARGGPYPLPCAGHCVHHTTPYRARATAYITLPPA